MMQLCFFFASVKIQQKGIQTDAKSNFDGEWLLRNLKKQAQITFKLHRASIGPHAIYGKVVLYTFLVLFVGP